MGFEGVWQDETILLQHVCAWCLYKVVSSIKFFSSFSFSSSPLM